MWLYESVRRLRVGQGALACLPEEVQTFGSKALLVCGRHLLADGTADRVVCMLQDSQVTVEVLPGPAGEPTLQEVASTLEKARKAACSVVIGMGGGSVLDTAKAMAGLYHTSGEPHKLVMQSLTKGPAKAVALPWIAVPTTAGTGSEVTHVSVVSDPIHGVKQSMRSSDWYAQAVIIDPTLYATAPPEVTAAAGMDALTQAIESHTSRGTTPLTKALSLQATVLIARHIVRAYRDGSDLEAREATALGSCLAGMALTNARLGAVHGLAHPVGIRYGLPHGRVCAMLLPHVMRFNMSVAVQGYAELAVAIGLGSEGSLLGYRLLEFVEQINTRMGIPAKLSTVGMQAEHIPALAKAALPSGSTKANPRSVGVVDLEELLTAAL